ncbi:ABC transporter permease subunit (plasmid) [Lachnospiraceae bacterium WCA-9-b2]|uniref:ABC transporter permease subunit n=1 Tax=Sporofaciens musculi TaxID=2681861 RepID=A0A7X3MM98_9FIRM|nr:carbohydrate ABC transporter permease [Sporofaciens musculi]MXP79053.1 ABC transporter permease subunit [Sporofaciens musculi]
MYFRLHLGRKAVWILLIVLALLAVYPVIFLSAGSLMGADELEDCLGAVVSGAEGYASFPVLPKYPTLQHFVEVLLDSPEFFVMFWNSILITFGVLGGQFVAGTMAAWGFARYEFPCKRGIFLLYIVLMLLPFQVLMLSDYLLLDRLRLLDSLWAVILPGMFSTFPVFIMYRFFAEIPDSLIESARLDGAREWQLFWYLALPMGSSGIIAALVLGFLEYWSLIEQPLTFIKDKSKLPLSVFLPDLTMTGKAGFLFAVSVVTFLPAIIVFMGGRDYLEQGIMAGAVKE